MWFVFLALYDREPQLWLHTTWLPSMEECSVSSRAWGGLSSALGCAGGCLGSHGGCCCCPLPAALTASLQGLPQKPLGKYLLPLSWPRDPHHMVKARDLKQPALSVAWFAPRPKALTRNPKGAEHIHCCWPHFGSVLQCLFYIHPWLLCKSAGFWSMFSRMET